MLELSDYSVQDIAQTVRSTLEPLAADKKLGFKVEVAPQLPPGRGDGRRLTQVLINLVGNAIKFTDAGEVAIKAEANNGSFHGIPGLLEHLLFERGAVRAKPGLQWSLDPRERAYAPKAPEIREANFELPLLGRILLSYRKIIPRGAPQSRMAEPMSASSTVCKSKVERLIVLSTSAVAVCC